MGILTWKTTPRNIYITAEDTYSMTCAIFGMVSDMYTSTRGYEKFKEILTKNNIKCEEKES